MKVKKYYHRGYLIIMIFIAFLTFVAVQINFNKNHLHRSSVDEVHTVYQSLNSINTGTVQNYRALEGSRWLVKAFYPVALIGMNKKMGGNVKNDSWGYPGHNYVRKNYVNKTAKGTPERPNMNDPNIRNLFYYFRLQNLFFAFISLLALIVYVWKEKYYFAGFLLSVLTGINTYFMLEKSVFYIETSFFAFINLLIILFLYLTKRKSISYFFVILTSFISAFTLSIKFSCVFFIFLLFALIVFKERQNIENTLKKTLTFIVSFILFFKYINFYAFQNSEKFNTSLHQFFSNFWKYSTSERTLDQGFIPNFMNMLDVFKASLGYLTYLLPVLVVIAFIYLNKKNRLKYGLILGALLLTIGSILGEREYIPRNFVPFLGVILFLTGIFIDTILKEAPVFKEIRFKTASITLICFLIFAGFLFAKGGFIKKYEQIFPSSQNNISIELNKINTNKKNNRYVLIDFPNKLIEDQGIKNKIELNSFPNVYNKNFKRVNDSISALLNITDVVLIKNIKNNKQFTSYLLPKLYNKNIQFDDYFIFYNKTVK